MREIDTILSEPENTKSGKNILMNFNGWENRAKKIRVVKLNCDHQNILKPPHLKPLASFILQSVEHCIAENVKKGLTKNAE
jgi:thioesterase domain-containing protein